MREVWDLCGVWMGFGGVVKWCGGLWMCVWVGMWFVGVWSVGGMGVYVGGCEVFVGFMGYVGVCRRCGGVGVCVGGVRFVGEVWGPPTTYPFPPMAHSLYFQWRQQQVMGPQGSHGPQ